jgi:hypothetical protein
VTKSGDEEMARLHKLVSQWEEPSSPEPFPRRFWYGSLLHGVAAHLGVVLAAGIFVVAISRFFTGLSGIPSAC